MQFFQFFLGRFELTTFFSFFLLYYIEAKKLVLQRYFCEYEFDNVHTNYVVKCVAQKFFFRFLKSARKSCEDKTIRLESLGK